MSNLALFGGRPLRSRPFPAWPVFDEREEVTVTARDLDGAGGLGGPACDHVLRLVLPHADEVDSDRAKELVDDGQLRNESGRHRLCQSADVQRGSDVRSHLRQGGKLPLLLLGAFLSRHDRHDHGAIAGDRASRAPRERDFGRSPGRSRPLDACPATLARLGIGSDPGHAKSFAGGRSCWATRTRTDG